MKHQCCLDQHWLLVRAWRAHEFFNDGEPLVLKDAEPFELVFLHGAFNARVSKEPECAPVHSA